MCGIAGVVDYSSTADNTVTSSLTRSMADLLDHRGPDGRGFADQQPAWLAHTRLAIIDVAGSPQPMSSDDDRYTLVFNGEIVNYRELRTTHQLDCVTEGDTEVLLRMLLKFGTEALVQLRGQFAFGLWDSQEQTLLLSRDRLGVLPLFWTASGSRLAFSSELPSMQPAMSTFAFDPQCLGDLLRRRAVPAPHTTIAGVRKVVPGTWMKFHPDASITEGRYWDAAAPRPTRSISPAAAADRLDELLNLSVAENLIADVPVGAYLSGGVDSSLIVAIAARHAAQPIKTFCAGFGGQDDERHHADLVARTVGSDHHEVIVDASHFIESLVTLTRFRGAPVSEVSDIAVAALAAEAVKQVKVVLSGEGSDELFAGYPKYRLAQASSVLGKIPVPVRHPVARLLAERGIGGPRGASLWQSLQGSTADARLAGWFSPINSSDAEKLGLPSPRATRATAVGSAVHQMEVADLLAWLPDNLLERGDRMTMSASLELRPPFLDPRIVEFALELAASVKLHERTNKWPVREVAKRYVPASLIDRPKIGFRVPLGEWLRQDLYTPVAELLNPKTNRSSQYINSEYGLQLLQAHRNGRDLTKKIWPLMTLEVYLRSLDQLP
jgi:asparagine synthase (glutamine-hydrolysing)